MSSAKVLILGGGTMGLASAWALARRGHAVEVFERFEHAHGQGSHGGHTRAFRHAYHEGSDYVELVRRADREWTELAARVGQQLLVRCGLVEFGPPEDPEFRAAIAALAEHDIAHETMDAERAMARWPFELPREWVACLAPDSGYLRVRACLDAFRSEAEAAGARIHHGVRIAAIEFGDRPTIRFEDGARASGDRLVVCAGAWAPGLLGPELFGREPARPLRRVLGWALPAPSARPRLRELPVWAAFDPRGFFYGFPDADEGVSGFKLACHNLRAGMAGEMDRAVDPDQVDREVHDPDLAPLRDFIARRIPSASGPFVASSVCLYTQTASGDFWIDRHPDDERVVVAAGFSGHGFKFAPAIGLAVSELIDLGESELALPRFRAAAHR